MSRLLHPGLPHSSRARSSWPGFSAGFPTARLRRCPQNSRTNRVKQRVLIRVSLLVSLVALVVLSAPAARAAPAREGVFVFGHSLGGVGVGMKKARVLREWGKRHGVCRNCRRATWYFNFSKFMPQGAGVVLAAGRVVHVFTIWKPSNWQTEQGLELGHRRARLLIDTARSGSGRARATRPSSPRARARDPSSISGRTSSGDSDSRALGCLPAFECSRSRFSRGHASHAVLATRKRRRFFSRRTISHGADSAVRKRSYSRLTDRRSRTSRTTAPHVRTVTHAATRNGNGAQTPRRIPPVTSAPPIAAPRKMCWTPWARP